MEKLYVKNPAGNRRLVEVYDGNIAKEILPLLERQNNNLKGLFLSERDLRNIIVTNYDEVVPIDRRWSSSTLLATKGREVRVILPYNTDGKLTGTAEFAFGLIDSYGTGSDISDKWNKIEGSGVYVRNLEDWFREGSDGRLIGLNNNMTEEEAMNCPILRTKLGDSFYVDSKFSRGKEKADEIIRRIFEIGKREYGYEKMMGQYFPKISNNGVLRFSSVGDIGTHSISDSRESSEGNIAFYKAA